jgi:hypothetical protein
MVFIYRRSWMDWNNQKILDLGFDGVNSNGQWEAECKVKRIYSTSKSKRFQIRLRRRSLLKYNYEKV